MLNSCITLSLGLLPGLSTAGYVGPGAGLTMLSALLAVALVLLLALLAPLLYLVRLTRAIFFGKRTSCDIALEPQPAQRGDEGQMGRP